MGRNAYKIKVNDSPMMGRSMTCRAGTEDGLIAHVIWVEAGVTDGGWVVWDAGGDGTPRSG